MGMEIVVPAATVDVAALLERVTSEGLPAMLAMVDGALVAPGTLPPASWREIRVRTPAGTVTLARRGGTVAVVVFGNADEALRGAQEHLARAITATKG